MGNEESASVRIANDTNIPLVYVISQAGPLYWGVIQPGKRVTRVTGRIWFTITCYPHDPVNDNQPTISDAVWGNAIPAAAAIAILVSAGMAAVSALPIAGAAAVSASALPTAGPVSALLAPIIGDAAIAAEAAVAAGGTTAAACSKVVPRAKDMMLSDAATRCLNSVSKSGHYANGEWIHVRGGPRWWRNPSKWRPIYFDE